MHFQFEPSPLADPQTPRVAPRISNPSHVQLFVIQMSPIMQHVSNKKRNCLSWSQLFRSSVRSSARRSCRLLGRIEVLEARLALAADAVTLFPLSGPPADPMTGGVGTFAAGAIPSGSNIIPPAAPGIDLEPWAFTGWDDALVISKDTGTNTSGSSFTTADTIFVDLGWANLGTVTAEAYVHDSLNHRRRDSR